MAQIPDQNGIPQVSASPTVPNDYQNIRPSPQDFGADVAQGAKQLGQGISQAGNDMTNVLVMRQQRYNELATNDAFNQFQNRTQDLTWGNSSDPTAPKGLYTLTGADALAAGQGVQKQISDERDRIKAGLSNDAQKLQFDEQSRRLLQYTQGEIARHLDAQTHTYNTAVNKATEEVADRQAGLTYNNPDA